jgi:hypothetical protein
VLKKNKERAQSTERLLQCTIVSANRLRLFVLAIFANQLLLANFCWMSWQAAL